MADVSSLRGLDDPCAEPEGPRDVPWYVYPLIGALVVLLLAPAIVLIAIGFTVAGGAWIFFVAAILYAMFVTVVL